MAVSVLKDALAREPLRDDLRNHLARLQRARPGRVTTKSSVPTAIVVVHMLLAWSLLIGSLVLLLLAPTQLTWLHPAVFSRGIQETGTGGLALWITLAVGWMIAAPLLAIKLFSWLWFAYMRWLPEVHALAADECLPSAMATSRFGGAYLRAREKFFANRYGGLMSSVASEDA